MFVFIIPLLLGINILLLTSIINNISLFDVMIFYFNLSNPCLYFFLATVYFMSKNFEKIFVKPKKFEPKYTNNIMINAGDMFAFTEKEPIFKQFKAKKND